MPVAYTGARLFDGHRIIDDAVLVVDGKNVSDIAENVPKGVPEVALAGGLLAPGFIDLQVNGSGGMMVDGQTDAARLAAICAAQARLGATGILPTLITDHPAATAAVIAAGIAAVGAPGFLGLHLEGPHLDPRRKGAHDPALIRPMQADDLAQLLHAAERLPALMVTLAPASVTPEQISSLAAAGVIVSLGHAECSFDEAQAAIAAGARCATHLFNAMSQLGNREPGLVGAVLTSDIAAGLIADGLHVAPAAMKIALAARPSGLFLVSDCMSVAGTDLTEFTLGGRHILRHQGRLTLEDGTLAGADLTLARAVSVLVSQVGLAPEAALAMATSSPANVIGQPGLGRLAAGGAASFVHLADDFTLQAVWQEGEKRL